MPDRSNQSKQSACADLRIREYDPHGSWRGYRTRYKHRSRFSFIQQCNGYVQFSTKKYMNKLELIRRTQEHSISSNRTILVVWHTQTYICKICVSSEERSLTDPKCSHPWRWCGFNLNSYLCISVSAYNRSQRRPCTKIIVHFGRKPKIISGSPFETQ